MPIGDLLAQISGGKGDDAAMPSLKSTKSIPAKRKPDDDLRRDDYKTPRTVQTPGLGTSKSKVSQGHYIGSARPTGTSGSKSATSAPKVSKSVLPSRPSPAPAAAAAPRGPPKKGSFAEILARGQRAQAVMGQVGKIQHKKVEKGAVKRHQDEPEPALVQTKGRALGGYAGTAKPGQRPSQRNGGPNGAHKTPVKDSRPSVSARPVPAGRDKSKAAAAADEAEAAKKVKKAAQATTGYTGTARPKPGNPIRKKDAPRGGALLNVTRHTSTKSSRYEDDYDEELDDFIEYDDEEEDVGGPGYGYASDGSSDMEAGLEDIDHEERRAEFIGRREDQKEERLEKSLKAAKEERKRRALEEMRARRR